jgi:hypothetical protein
MPRRDSIIISLLSVSILLVSFLILSLFLSRGKPFVKASTELNQYENVSSQNPETVLEASTIEESVEYSSLNICYEENCETLNSDIVESFYIEEKLDTQSVYTFLLENVVGYFEELSGGKVLVKNSKGSFYTWKEDFIIDTSDMFVDVVELLKEFGKKGIALKYDLYKKEAPGTDGSYASKYIEIDNSRQKLYAWKDGEVVKEIKLSAAKYGWQVYGVFPIVDKGIQPMAPSGNYMPYWMAFYYSPSQKSWYGLHGLVWWYDDNGNVVHENIDYIGVRRSKGCIRMLKDDAKYLYDRYEKGDHILIHE